MIPIENTLVSFDLIEKQFSCDLACCKGACCVEGDSGAPISREEEARIQKIYPALENRMKSESALRVQRHGLSFVDREGELVTMIHENSGECVFAVQENGISKCLIEIMHFEGKYDFRKPVSCHLYPIRVKEYPDFTAVNYDAWDICKPGLVKGEKLGTPLYKFAGEALVRRFGEEWYAQLEVAAKDFLKE